MNTLQFAEYELRRYGAQMGIFPEITLEVAPQAFSAAPFFKFDPALDDAFRISVKNGEGTISATTPRAVLLGVYRFHIAGVKIGGIGVVQIVVAVHHIDSRIPESILRLQLLQLLRQRSYPAQFPVA